MPNRLAQSQSLYLRKHAENPIDWWPWCDEALETARRENKPIFLSIGYSSCHWCTVMEGEAFSDGAIAAVMNSQFLPIKVDREERPDIDSIYMQALQLMTGSGGWPLNIFLSPEDRVPFYAGTYFPVEPKYGRPAFLDILQRLRQIYDTEPDKLGAVKAEILGRLHQAALIPGGADLSAAVLRQGLISTAGIVSSRGMGPSFPMIPYAATALRAMQVELPEYDVADICRQRGLDLALGGIYDHVAGGFHRYAVDATWTVPHFEKMLYDNGQILEYLADLWSAGMREPAFERAIAQTVTWLYREMTAPLGYFYAAQDADSFASVTDPEPEEGAFYVWRYSDLQRHLSESELQHLAAHFTVTPTGNFEGQNVLQRYQPAPLSDDLEAILQRLFAVRYGALPATVPTFPPARTNQEAKTHPWPGRIPAVTDTKMIVAWNSLMISGLARAATVFQSEDYRLRATQAAQFILDQQWIDGRFHRLNYDGQATVIAQSEDYGCFIKALLDLEQSAINSSDRAHPDWLAHAIRVQDEFDEYLWSVEWGGYYNTDARDDLVIRERSYDDHATPSANGVAIANLVRLFLLTENTAYLDRAEQALQSFSTILSSAPQRCPSLFAALDWFRNPILIRTSSDTIATLSRQYGSTVVYRCESHLPEGAVGLVCQGLSCQEPAQTWEQLDEQVRHAIAHRI